MFILALIAAVAAPAAGKAMALDDWHQMRIVSVGRDTSARPPYYLRVQAADLDGDGLADQADLKLVCADGVLKEAFYTIISPRDFSAGQSSGRHMSFTGPEQWAPASPQLSAVRPTYDVKKMEGARVGRGSWAAISLRNADGLCASTEAAAKAIVKSKSNISNN